MFQYFRTRSRLKFFETYLKNATLEDLSLLETNFAMSVVADMPALLEANDISVHKLGSFMGTMVRWHNLQLKDFESQDCDLMRMRREEMGVGGKKRLLCVDSKVLLNHSLIEINQWSVFFALRILTAYLMYFYYIGILYKSLRPRIYRIMNILEQHRDRESSYEKIYNSIFPGYLSGKEFYARSGCATLEEILQVDPDDNIYKEIYSSIFSKERKDELINLDIPFMWWENGNPPIYTGAQK